MKKRSFQLFLSPFVFQIQTDIELVLENARLMYGERFKERVDDEQFVDYYLSIVKSSGVRHFYKPQARFFCDSREPFKPLRLNQAFAMLEWGMNWTIASHELQYCIVHSGVLEKDGKAILFPAPPGSGKSTLTAFLANNGWRLLSDEMAMILPQTNQVIPFVRPICLKNQSIQLAKNWFSGAKFSSIARDTHKGDVIHMAPNSSAFKQNQVPAKIVGVVFPQYRPNAELAIYQLDMADAFMQLAQNTFNFRVLGNSSFTTLTQLIETIQSFEIHYSDLEEVEAFLREDIIERSS
uniref:HprK-related kinase A n=1 Tax=Ningiella ruwaisensis TaxID=2364274 RepID=UPI00109F3520|nr:HprK-related kinase A [Ningiella ruwaisensis]